MLTQGRHLRAVGHDGAPVLRGEYPFAEIAHRAPPGSHRGGSLELPHDALPGRAQRDPQQDMNRVRPYHERVDEPPLGIAHLVQGPLAEARGGGYLKKFAVFVRGHRDVTPLGPPSPNPHAGSCGVEPSDPNTKRCTDR